MGFILALILSGCGSSAAEGDEDLDAQTSNGASRRYNLFNRIERLSSRQLVSQEQSWCLSNWSLYYCIDIPYRISLLHSQSYRFIKITRDLCLYQEHSSRAVFFL